MKLEQKVCLVTGGTKGIGAAAAISLAKLGANISLVACHGDDEAKRTRQQIESLGRKCALIGADMGNSSDASQCVDQTVRDLGSVDVVVHSAGGPVNGGLFDITPEVWARAFDVHIHAI